MAMARNRFFFFIILTAHFFISACQGGFIGFNYGTKMSMVPNPRQVVNLLKAQNVRNLRIFEPDSLLLRTLSGTGIEVAIGIPNDQLLSIGGSALAADSWVATNILAYMPDTNITCISVGNEVLTSHPSFALLLLPAMRYLHRSLTLANLHKRIKISTPISASLILDSFPPSEAFFNKSWSGVMKPLLGFLDRTSSYLMLNVRPFDVYKLNLGVIALDYALLDPLAQASVVVDSNTVLRYTGLFDAIVDSVFYAMEGFNHSQIRIVISETGWPSRGDPDATPDNASAYLSNLIKRITNNTGTPRHPHARIDTFLFELFNEDLAMGGATSKSYGLFNASSNLPLYLLRPPPPGTILANATASELHCVAKPDANISELQAVLDWTCGVGQVNCSAIRPGQPCYQPDTVLSHASYAFDNYFQTRNRSLSSCDFNGTATVSTANPSYGTCLYPGSSNTNGFMNSTSTTISASSGNETTNSSGIAVSSNNKDVLAIATVVAFTLSWSLQLL